MGSKHANSYLKKTVASAIKEIKPGDMVGQGLLYPGSSGRASLRR